MPTFSYTARSINGQIKSGFQEAATESELARTLRNAGYILTSAKSSKHSGKKIFKLSDLFYRIAGIPLVEKMMFAQHLAVMTGAGIPLTRSVETLSLQTKNQKFSKVLKEVNLDIRKGLTLADSLSKYKKVFPEIFVNMVKVGEASGNLEEVLKVSADQMKKDYELKSKVRNAMIYPGVIMAAMAGIGALMMILVVPKLTQVFKELNTELPISTKFIIGLSDFMSQHWIMGILIAASIAFGIRYLMKSSSFKSFFDSFILKTPIFGNISKKINSARMARTLGVLIKSGVPIVQGIGIVSGTLSNEKFRISLEKSAQEVQKGQALSQSLKNYPDLYPPIVEQMVEVGEETGTTDQILITLAEFYEDEINNTTKNLSSIIEPILMVVIGVAVGFFALSMLTPMYSIMQGM